MEYNLTTEHQFGSEWAASVSYVGNGGRKFTALRDENSPVYSPTCTAAACGTAASELARRPYKPTTTPYVFNSIYEFDPESSSSYNSLQAMLTRSFAHRLSLQATYVWSKDMGYGVDPSDSGTSIAAESSYDYHLDYGKLSFDVPQHFVASYLWLSPEIQRWGLIGKEALSGWQFNGITTLSTGQPFNMVSGSDTNFDGVPTTDRPNLVGNPVLKGQSRQQKAGEFFNSAAFAPVPVGTATGEGNTQYDMMIDPGTINTNLSAFKNFPIQKENTLQFRADAFNLFGNVNLSNPTAQLSSPSDGKITSSAAGRIIQLALKYSF
jgi:hypothetical protein